jgi:hypothetical protein
MPPLIGDPPDEAGGAAPESGAWREKEEQKEEKDKAKGASEDPHDARARCSDDPVLVATRKHGKGRRGPGERRQRRELQPRRREREQRELEREEQRELERQQRERQLGNAVQDLSLALDGLVWAVQGSYAAVLHGAPIEAGDIDVLVKDVPTALNALFIGGFHLEGGTLLVYKLKHRNDTDIDLVSTGGGDFGIDPANRVSMGGVYVMNLCEVLKSLLMRPKRRDKDVIAFIWLVLHKGDTLDEQQRESIALLATKDRQTHIPGLEECQSWEQLVIKLREHASEPKTTTRA